MILKYNGCISEEEYLPGGGPQGTKLGLYLFLVLINAAGFKPTELCTNLGETVTKPKRKAIPKSQQKYVDDMTQCVSVNLKKAAEINPIQIPVHLRKQHERTGHVLKEDCNPLQTFLDSLKEYAKENKMVINETKTKVMIFNQATSIDVHPTVKLDQNKILEVVDEMKLLGVMIRSDMKWHSNTKNLIVKSYQRMWMLRNLKRNGANEDQLLRTYFQQIRSMTEMACPVWTAGLTLQDIGALERVQKTALAIIRGGNHTTYRDALKYFNILTLESRRENLCLKFALKASKSAKFAQWFSKNDNQVNTRSDKPTYKSPKSRTRRYGKSPIPYLTNLLNTHLSSEAKKSEKSKNRV